MRVLFIGDIVGPAAVDYVCARVPDFRDQNAVDLVIANAENSIVSADRPSTGFGMDLETVERLVASRVDVITSGNHAWDNGASIAALDHPRVIRPLNVPETYAGRGRITLNVGDDHVTVLNFIDGSAFHDVVPIDIPKLKSELRGTTIVDFHSGDVMQKLGFAHAMDGRVAAVLGTHTHESTRTLHHLPQGTALVLDVGMTGPSGGWQGIEPTHLIAWYLNEEASELPPFQLAQGPIELGAILFETEDGLTRSISRLEELDRDASECGKHGHLTR